jgi:hypothetical protein
MSGYETLSNEDQKLLGSCTSKKAGKRKLADQSVSIKAEKFEIKQERNDENEDPEITRIKTERLEKEKQLKV